MMQKCGVGGACCGSQGSGCLEFRKRMARMDSLDKHVVTCCEHLICSRKAHRPASNPRRLKAESRQFFIDFQQSGIYDNRDHNQCPVIHILDTSTLSFASMMQPSCRADGACCGSQRPQSSGRNWIPFDKDVEQISFRQCVTFSERGQLKAW